MKHSLLLAAFFFIHLFSFAQDSLNQKGFFISVNGQYAIGIGQQDDRFVVYSSSIVVDTAVSKGGQFTYRNRFSTSFGKGTDLGLSGGYGSGQWEAGVTASYFISDPVSFSQDLTSNMSDDYIDKRVYTASMIKFNPYFKVRTKSRSKLGGFVAAGLLLGVNGKITEMREYTGEGKNDDFKQRSVYSGGLAWGFSSQAGGEYKISEKLSVYAGLVFTHLDFAPRLGMEHVYEREDGASYGNHHIAFHDEVSFNTLLTYPYDEDGREIQLRRTYNLSSAGITAGCAYSF